jgi:tetratricopeptide (TPR) repeat protein
MKGPLEMRIQMLETSFLFTLLQKAQQERFISPEVLQAISNVITSFIVHEDFEMITKQHGIDVLCIQTEHINFMDLFKQFYVTLGESDGGKATIKVIQSVIRLVHTKEKSKEFIRQGEMLRSVVQLAIQHRSDLHALVNAIQLLVHLCQLVCFIVPEEYLEVLASSIKRTTEEKSIKDSEEEGEADEKTITAHIEEEKLICDLVVLLMLSGISSVRQEGIRLLQMIVENHAFDRYLPVVKDTRGALELAKASLSAGKVTDSYVATLCSQLYTQLIPRIDQYERQHGSLIGLNDDNSDLKKSESPKDAINYAEYMKHQGNQYFKSGNFPYARFFYRRALSTLKIAQFNEENQYLHFSEQEILKRCSAGATVKVLSTSSGLWEKAMVSDIEEGLIDICYDISGKDELVPPSRVRLCMNTHVLKIFDSVRIDCCMNMGKALSQMYDSNAAIECFSHVLQLQSDHIQALYYRGITWMAIGSLKNAKADLWDANKHCIAQHNVTMKEQVSKAWKRLQVLFTRKKKTDKKLIKQMIQYLSTVPGVEQQ